MRNWTSTSCVIFTFHSHSHLHAQSSTANFCNSLNNFSCSFAPFSSSSRFTSLPISLSVSFPISHLQMLLYFALLPWHNSLRHCIWKLSDRRKKCGKTVEEGKRKRKKKKTSKEQEIWIRKLFHFFSFFATAAAAVAILWFGFAIVKPTL